ncbi:hypothetical protein RUND412_007304 [Rhizina undulata]
MESQRHIDIFGEKPKTLFNIANLLRFIQIGMFLYKIITIGQWVHEGILNQGFTSLYIVFAVSIGGLAYTLVAFTLMTFFAFNLGSVWFSINGGLDVFFLVWSAVCTYFGVQINNTWDGREGQGDSDLIAGQRLIRHKVVLSFSILNMIFFFACFCISMKLGGMYKAGMRLEARDSPLSRMIGRRRNHGNKHFAEDVGDQSRGAYETGAQSKSDDVEMGTDATKAG